MWEDTFSCDISLIDHFNLVHCEGIMDELNNIVTDNNEVDDNEVEQTSHISNDSNSGYDSDEYYERVYKESEYGEYTCLVCSRKFISNERLNEHFLRFHSSYDDTLQLDEDNMVGGFPGFNVLQHMNVFHYSEHPDTDCCPICFDSYDKNDRLTDKLHFNENEYVEDNDDETENYPIHINCCNQYMCSQCLKTYIMTKNKVICPFCQYNHEIDYTEFISIPKFCKCNEESWDEWRKKHPLDTKP